MLFTLIGADKPPEVIVRSLVRAQMCELLATDIDLERHESEVFLMGMFSMLDVLIGRPLVDILEEMNISKEVKGALLGEENAYRDLYNVVVNYENGDWDTCFQAASKLNIDPESIPQSYVKAVEWADEVARVGSRQSK